MTAYRTAAHIDPFRKREKPIWPDPNYKWVQPVAGVLLAIILRFLCCA